MTISAAWRNGTAIGGAIALLLGISGPARGSIYGTLSNFDIYNETPHSAYGAEIELEGIHVEDIAGTFPANFNSETKSSYTDGTLSGVKIVYSGYNFGSQGFLSPTVGQSTNGHACVYTGGCEHFGFALVANQPTATRFYWLDQSGQRIGTMPESVPGAEWVYNPGAGGGGRDVIGARVEMPDNPEHPEQQPDSVWMKVFKTEIDRPVDLAELMSNNGIVPDSVGETESEWELLEGGRIDEADDDRPDDSWAVIRRYEYYEYTGLYDEEHEPLSTFLGGDMAEPPVDELGQFISSNMVAANLAAPQEGDFDQDGRVDGGDFMTWQRGFGDRHGKLEIGDADWDDDIDGDDLSIWRGQLGRGADDGGQVLANATPEPASLALMAAAGVLAELVRRRNA